MKNNDVYENNTETFYKILDRHINQFIGTKVYIIGKRYVGGRSECFINTGKFRLSDIEKIDKTVFFDFDSAKAEVDKWLAQDDRLTLQEITIDTNEQERRKNFNEQNTRKDTQENF